MGEESPKPASTPTGAVFLSYASQDAEAAQQICKALRAAGIVVWFDQSELRGGDAWDQKIRQQIRDCDLFIPIISQHTQERLEGYFRLEWKLAVDRSHLMAVERPFLMPVVVDGTRDQEAFVPDSFRAVQWTRLSAGETAPAFVDQVQRLLSPERARNVRSSERPVAGLPERASWRLRSTVLTRVGVITAMSLAYWIFERSSPRKSQVAPQPQLAQPATAGSTAFSPPAHSIAVLPFVNMSGDKEQDYFSDGLTEELLNSLTRINELQVAARTSAFSFKGKDTDIDTIARKLNVAAVLEGSVRRSTHTVRITAQLVNAITGFHVWSRTYDRNLGDVLALQTEIATSVANALKVTLLEDTTKKIELGGTTIPQAFDAYLRGMKIARTALSDQQTQAAIAAYTEAIHRDPHFAMAFAERSLEHTNYAIWHAQGPAVRASFDEALADARSAVSLAPELAEGHYALAVVVSRGSLDFTQANQEYGRALTLAPGSARILGAYSRNAAELVHTAVAITAARRAVTLDPLNFHVHRTVGIVYLLVRRYADAVGAFRTAISLQPDLRNYALLGQAQYQFGDFEAARSSCEAANADAAGQYCLAVVYRKLGREADAEAMLQRIRSSSGDESAYDLACIYAQWGNIPKALESLETAVRLRDAGLAELKAQPALDPLRNEPRFRAIERELRFPN